MAQILIIEDESSLAQAYEYMLKTRGHTIICAADGELGLLAAKNNPPDLILLDLMMPNLDGIGFLRKYRAKDHPQVKIILLSNMQSQERANEALALGACRFELKATLSPPELLDIVDEVLAT